jgi:hypothetical protein
MRDSLELMGHEASPDIHSPQAYTPQPVHKTPYLMEVLLGQATTTQI